MMKSSVRNRAVARPTRSTAIGALAAATGVMLFVGVLALPSAAGAVTPTVDLGTVAAYSVIAGSTVTNVPSAGTVLAGDLGVNPGSAITGFPPGIVGGAVHAGDAVAGTAQSDLTTAYNSAAGRAGGADIGAAVAGDTTLTPGVYKAKVALNLGGKLTLDGQGNPMAVFIFQIGSALTVASATHVLLSEGAQACNVFWQIGTSATVGTNSAFVGTIMALASITVQSGTNVQGRALARNGQVALDDNVFTAPGCDTSGPSTSPTFTPPTTTAPAGGPTTTAPGSIARVTPTGGGGGTGTGTATGVVGHGSGTGTATNAVNRGNSSGSTTAAVLAGSSSPLAGSSQLAVTGTPFLKPMLAGGIALFILGLLLVAMGSIRARYAPRH